MKISISEGISEFQVMEFVTVKELAAQACKTNISTSVFKNGKRNIESFEFAECIGLDIDNDNKIGTPVLSIEEAAQAFEGLKHVILTTRSHRKEKHGVVADRFRVILFLETPITNAEDFYATWFYLKAKYPWIDNQCKDPSRFWYRHGGVYGGKDGALITPVKHVALPKETKDAPVSAPGTKGELSKATLKLLEFGVERGSRNGAVYKAAREFHQNLYTQEEAESRIVAALERNNIFSSDFTEDEVRTTIASAFSKDAKHDARVAEVKPRAFKYIGLGELLDREEEQEHWLVDGLLIKGGLSIMVGIPKIGKTTIIRQLERCVLRGESFLQRKVEKGTVLHYSFDEKARTAKRHYKTLGLTNEDPMMLHFGTADSDDHKQDLEEDLMAMKPALVVVDTLFDMVNADDVNSYGPIKRELAFYNALAERTGCHIMFIHHQNKPNKEYGRGSGHSILGSTAIFGSVDCCLIFERPDDKPDMRTIAAIGRGVDGFDKKILKFDKVKQIYSIDEVEF